MIAILCLPAWFFLVFVIFLFSSCYAGYYRNKNSLKKGSKCCAKSASEHYDFIGRFRHRNKNASRSSSIGAYHLAKITWSSRPATVEEMIGEGCEYMSDADISDAISILKEFVKPGGSVQTRRALDCGSGIGRIAKHVLLPVFEKVDLVEINQKFLDVAKNSYLSASEVQKVGNFICLPLEKFTPTLSYYNTIWIQGVLEHLYEQDAVSFLFKCKQGLTQDGVIFLKENINDDDMQDSEFDKDLQRHFRSRNKWLELIKLANLNVITEGYETIVYPDVLEVRTFVLR